jgi:soluble lytic murein transglycosylase
MQKFWAILIIYFIHTSFAQASELRSDESSTLKALDHIKSQKWDLAYEQAKHSTSPKYTKALIDFAKIVSNTPTLSETLDTYNKNTWFPICAFQNEIERQITVGVTNQELKNWFSICAPNSNAAKLLALHYQINTGKKNFDKQFINSWTKSTNPPIALDSYLFKFYKGKIPLKSISTKVDNLIWEGNFNLAKIYNKYLPSKEQETNNLRIQYAQGHLKYEKLIKKHPSLKKDEFILQKQISKLIKKNQDHTAYGIFTSINTFTHSEKWWKPKHVLIRNLIKAGKYNTAYKISSQHGLSSGESYQDAEWISGWIALRFLHKPNIGVNHFYRAYLDARYSTSKSKAAYWLARCFKALRNNQKAEKWWLIASQYKSHFYGQLATLERTDNLEINFFDSLSDNNLTVNSIDENVLKLANAIYLYHQSGNKIIAKVLTKHLAETNLDNKVKYIIADYFQQKGLVSLSIQFAKYIANHNGPLFTYGYPLDAPLKVYNNPKALYLALIRQESNFDQSAISPAGAIGLMQLMPATAKQYAKILGLPHNGFKVSASHNVAKGVYYLDALTLNFGSIVPAIAAYNAGEGAVARWIEAYGNPTNKKSRYEIIDWIESIPYSETRLYVKKVLENMIVYEKILQPNKPQHQFLVSYLGK